jgi:hypothetical protein
MNLAVARGFDLENRRRASEDIISEAAKAKDARSLLRLEGDLGYKAGEKLQSLRLRAIRMR